MKWQTNNVLPAALTAAVVAMSGFANAELVYQVTGNVTGGFDLTAMEGYYADRFSGPSAAEVTIDGAIGHDPASNPFYILGNGKRMTFTSDTTLTNVPVVLLPSEGITARTDYQFNAPTHFVNGLQIRKNARLVIAYGKPAPQFYGNGSDAVDFTIDGGQVYGSAAPIIGNEIGDANLKVLNGAAFHNDYDMYLGREISPGRSGTPIHVTADIRASIEMRVLLLMSGVHPGAVAEEHCFITNGVNGKIQAWSIHHSGGNYSRIVFNGGKYVSSSANRTESMFHVSGYSWRSAYPSPHMMVESINGYPIDIEIPVDRNFSGGNSDRQVNVSGDGGFTKRGVGVLTFSRVPASYINTRSKCTLTGPTKVLGGGIRLQDADFTLGRGALEVSAGAFFDVNGIATEFIGASGDGILTNGVESAASVKFGYGDQDGDFDIATCGIGSIVKTGTGTLTVGARAAGYAGDLSVSGGTVRVSAGVSLSLASLSVAPNAVFDADGASLRLSSLSVDFAVGASRMSSFAPAANGVLDVSNFPAGKTGVCELPIAVAALDDASDNLATWSVKLNGRVRPRAHVCVENGKLCVNLGGFVMSIR